MVFIKRSKRAYESFIETVKIRRVNHPRQLIHFNTMTYSDKGTMNRNTNCNHFGAVSFGINVNFIAHTDDNATYYVASVHQYEHP